MSYPIGAAAMAEAAAIPVPSDAGPQPMEDVQPGEIPSLQPGPGPQPGAIPSTFTGLTPTAASPARGNPAAVDHRGNIMQSPGQPSAFAPQGR